MHHQLMRVCIILHAFHTCIHCKHHHPCIMVYASFGQHHGNCIVSYAWSRSCMGSLILMLHHHCNHTSQQCIMFIVIYRTLHSKLEHFVIIPWLHRYINSEQECFKHHLSLILFSLAIYKFCDECHRHLSFSWLWSQFYENLITFSSLILSNSSMYNLFMLSLYSSCHALVINLNLLWCDCFLSLLMGDLLHFPLKSFVRISGRDSF
jgi:hypothetical protein